MHTQYPRRQFFSLFLLRTDEGHALPLPVSFGSVFFNAKYVIKSNTTQPSKWENLEELSFWLGCKHSSGTQQLIKVCDFSSSAAGRPLLTCTDRSEAHIAANTLNSTPCGYIFGGRTGVWFLPPLFLSFFVCVLCSVLIPATSRGRRRFLRPQKFIFLLRERPAETSAGRLPPLRTLRESKWPTMLLSLMLLQLGCRGGIQTHKHTATGSHLHLRTTLRPSLSSPSQHRHLCREGRELRQQYSYSSITILLDGESETQTVI